MRQLYVKAAGENGSSAHAWYCVGAGGLIRTLADASDLPGPCGGHSLHVQPRQATADDDAHSQQLPKVCALEPCQSKRSPSKCGVVRMCRAMVCWACC